MGESRAAGTVVDRRCATCESWRPDLTPDTYPASLRIKLGVCANEKTHAVVPTHYSYRCAHWAARTTALDLRVSARAGVFGEEPEA